MRVFPWNRFTKHVIIVLAVLSVFAVGHCAHFPPRQSESLPPPDPNAVYKRPDAPVADRVADLLGQMSLREKIGQMTQVERKVFGKAELLGSFGVGSILSGGGSAPDDNSPAGWAAMTDWFQKGALTSRLGIPILYGIDAVHGHNTVKGAVIFPHNIGLGAAGNPELVEQVGRITALEMAATGTHWTFGPCVAVARDERWGRTYESYGETAELVSAMGRAMVKGVQGDGAWASGAVLATAKHFVGDGGTKGGKDQGDAVMDETTLRALHLPPYVAAVEAGVVSVMISQSSWNGGEMHAQKHLITEVLKGELGFDGFVVSDWQAIDQIPGGYYTDVTTAINAGIDMVMVPFRFEQFMDTLQDAVEDGDVPMARIDDAVSRILTAKLSLGLFENPLAVRDLIGKVGSKAHREVARQAVRESLVLLKNDGVLPLSKALGRIHVAGKNADDLGHQIGGWGITWQGGSGRVTQGTTVLDGIKRAVSGSTQVTYSEDGSGAEGADVGIVVIGEEPYAEWEGDSQDLRLAMEDVAAIDRVRKAGIPVVVILISGRPLIVHPHLKSWNALVAAWLPGTEGQGVSDVLFGDCSPTGKLPFSWPKSMRQVPINHGDADYPPAFELGYGLTYE